MYLLKKQVWSISNGTRSLRPSLPSMSLTTEPTFDQQPTVIPKINEGPAYLLKKQV